MPRTGSSARGRLTHARHPNWAWHEYGNRVGWRMLEVFDDFDPSRPGHQRLGASAYEPTFARPATELGVHGPRLHAEEHAEGGNTRHRRTTEAIISLPAGALRLVGPGLTETWETPDLLVEAGYTMSAIGARRPACCAEHALRRNRQHPRTRMQRRGDDVIQHHKASEYSDRASISSRSCTTMPATPRDGDRLAPYIMGAPHRLKYFRRVIDHQRRRRGLSTASRSSTGTRPSEATRSLSSTPVPGLRGSLFGEGGGGGWSAATMVPSRL